MTALEHWHVHRGVCSEPSANECMSVDLSGVQEHRGGADQQHQPCAGVLCSVQHVRLQHTSVRSSGGSRLVLGPVERLVDGHCCGSGMHLWFVVSAACVVWL